MGSNKYILNKKEVLVFNTSYKVLGTGIEPVRTVRSAGLLTVWGTNPS